MVTRLTGTVNGAAVIFQRIQGDEWEATVPSTLNGVYVVDMTAYDDAGNATYWAKYILTVDLSALCVHLVPCPYQAELLDTKFRADFLGEVYQAQLVSREYAAEYICCNYYASLVREECKGVGK